MNIFLDVETLPSQAKNARELARQYVKPPANYKKPESIAAWWNDEGDNAVEESFRKQSFDAAIGELCAVGFAAEDGEPVSLVRGREEPEADFIRRALAALLALVDSGGRTGPDGHRWPDEAYFIAHNAPFDLGFLLRRCWVHGIRPPFRLPGPNAREGKDYGDTMTSWAGYRGTIGLGRLCRALGLPSPKANGVDGGQVLDLWRAGEHEALARYNVADVAAVRACWNRLNWKD